MAGSRKKPKSAGYFAILPKRIDGAVNATFDGRLLTRMFEMKLGISRKEGWPARAVLLNLEPEHVGSGPLLFDVVDNSMAWLIVSAPLQQVLEESCPAAEVEYLPVSIEPERKGELRRGYFIANPLGLRTAADPERSQLKMDSVIIDQVQVITRIAMHPDLIAAGPALFRAREMNRYIFVRADLAERIRALGFTGVELIPAEELKTDATGAPSRAKG